MALELVSRVFDRHRGINDLSDIKRIEDDHLVTCENFLFIPTAQGRVQLEMRAGYDKDTMTTNLTSGTQIQGIHFAEFTAGNETIFSYNGKLYKLDTTPTDLSVSVTDTMHDFTMLEDVLLIANGSDAILEKSFGANPTTLGGSPPVGAYLHQWHNFVFVGKISGSLRTLRWSDISDKDTWTAGNTQDFPFEITGINSLGDTLYVFGKNEVWTVTGFTTSTFEFGDFAKVGCISHYGIVNNGNSLFWPAQDGIYALGNIGATDATVGGISLIKLSSEKLRTFWDTLDLATIGRIHGVHDVTNHCVRWTVRRSAESYNDREIVFDYHSNVLGFRTTKGINASCYALGKDSNEIYQVKFGESQTDSNGGLIYKLSDSETDDGSTIEGTIETKAYDFGRPDLDKYFHTARVLARGTASETKLNVSTGVGDFPDYSNTKQITTSTLAVYDTAKWDTDSFEDDSFKHYGIGINKLGKSLVMKMTSTESAKRMRIAGWTIDAQVHDPITTTNI